MVSLLSFQRLVLVKPGTPEESDRIQQSPEHPVAEHGTPYTHNTHVEIKPENIAEAYSEHPHGYNRHYHRISYITCCPEGVVLTCFC